MVWFELLWRQAFRSKRVIAPEAFLDANLTLGLFASLGVLACLNTLGRSHWPFTALLALTSATHVGGRMLAWRWGSLRSTILFVQGLCLFCAALALVVVSTELSLRAQQLSNVRYLPGIALSLFMHASFEVHFFGPAALQAWPVRPVALILGVAGELAMAAALIWHVAR